MSSPDGVPKPPTAAEAGFGIIAEAVGVTPVLMGTKDFDYHVLNAAAAATVEGEIKLEHRRIPDDQDQAEALRGQLGERNYADGALGANIAALAVEGTPEQQKAARAVIVASARRLAWLSIGKQVELPAGPTVSVLRSARKLTFDGTKAYPLPSDPGVIVDYGPGMRGRFHIDQQVIDKNAGQPTFEYIGLARGIFVPAFLAEHMTARGLDNPASVREITEGGLHVVRNDGIEDGITALVQERGAESVDVVLASAVHSAGEAALTGVRRAFELLKTKGVLMIRGPKQPDDYDPGVPVADLRQAALDAGFKPGRMRSYDTANRGPGGVRVDSQVIIFRK
jgi:hypothetical protein